MTAPLGYGAVLALVVLLILWARGKDRDDG